MYLLGTERDRHCLDPQPVRLQHRLRQPGRQLRRGPRVPARHRDHDRLLHRPADHPTEGASLMTVITAGLDQITEQLETPGRRHGRKPTSWLLTVFVLICVGYFLLPLFWLVVASTKSNADLFSSFGLWFAELQLVREHPDRADLPGRRVHPLGGQLGHLRRGQRRRRRVLGDRGRLRLRQVPVPGRNRLVRHHPRRDHDPCSRP